MSLSSRLRIPQQISTWAARLGGVAWRLALRRPVRVVVGCPLLALCLTGAGVRWWLIEFVSAEALVLLGYWLFVAWWLRRLRRLHEVSR